jgi:subtilisin family serine protease
MPHERTYILALTVLGILALAAVALLTSTPAAPQASVTTSRHVPGEILIRFKPEASQTDRDSIGAVFDSVKLHTFRSGAEHWVLGPTETVEQALTYLKSNVLVEYAEPNYILTADANDCVPAADGLCPIDPNFPEQWALRNLSQTDCTNDADIDATQAWKEVTTGSGLVALIDGGVDYNHPDLANNIWVNPLEIPGNAYDEDGCGKLNDVHGYDFENNDSDPYSSEFDAHGNYMAGIIAAVTDNVICEGPCEEGPYRGIAGVSWHAKLMLVQGRDTVSMAAQSIDYVVCMDDRVQKVDAINAAWGGFGYSQTLRNAIKAAGDRDILFVASAGNAGLNLDDGDPNHARYPASYDLPNIITVAATNCNDGLGPTNYGVVSVDLAAPGKSIMTTGGRTDPNSPYGWPRIDGTSPAAAHVSGVAALLRTLNPGFPGELIRKRIMDTGDYNGSTQGLTVTGERLNAYNAVVNQDIVAPAAISDLSATPGYTTMTLNWTATADDGSDPNSGPATAYQIRYASSRILNLDNWLDATRVGNEPLPESPGQAESFFRSGLQCNTTYDFAIRPFDEWGNGPMSVVTRKTLTPLCQISYCADEDLRCTWNGSCGATGCCNYSCSVDPTCTGSDPCPTGACFCVGGE